MLKGMAVEALQDCFFLLVDSVFGYSLCFYTEIGELGLANAGGGTGQRPCVVVGRKLPDLATLSKEWLSAAEEAAQQVVNCEHPTLDSEEKRRDIIDYLQRLVNGHLNCEIDCLVGRNHLFKRSIILVKTWCYYESRILGAHHGLISTYALETLVLYIFHPFHSSLSGPLAVLYKVLDYYDQFDWENYCVSLEGPVCKSSLPNIVVETTEGGWNNRMFSEEFLENCIEMFSFTSRVLEGNSKAFQVKHLNIVDPLKDNNNLGRSASRGKTSTVSEVLSSMELAGLVKFFQDRDINLWRRSISSLQMPLQGMETIDVAINICP